MPLTIKKKKKAKKVSEQLLGELIKTIEEDKSSAYNDTGPFRNRLPVYIDQTAGKLPAQKRKKKWESAVSLPATLTQLETVATRIFQSFFDGPEVCIMKPTGREDVEVTAKKEKWFNGRLKTYIRGFEDAIDRGIQKTCQHGINIAYQHYLREVKDVFDKREFKLDEDDVVDNFSIMTKCEAIINNIYGKNLKEIIPTGELKYKVVFKRRTQVGGLTDKIEDEATIDFWPDEEELTVTAEIEEAQIDYDGSVSENINIDDVWWPSSVKNNEDLQTCKFVCRRFDTGYSDIARKKQDGVYDLLTNDDLVELEKIKTSDNKENKKVTNKNKGNAGVNPNEEADSTKFIEGYECFYLYPINNDGYDKHIIIKYFPRIKKIASIRRLGEIYRHGKRPFVATCINLRENSIFSPGIPEVVAPLQDVLDILHNQFINNGTLVNTPWGLTKAHSSIASRLENKETELKPGILYSTDDPQNDINFPKFGQNPAWNLPDMGILFDYIEKAVGSSSLMQGKQQYSRQTAGGTMKLLAEANIRVKQYLIRMNRGIKEILKQLYQLEREYAPEKQTFRVTNERGEDFFPTITKKELQTLPDFEMSTSIDQLNKTFWREVYILLFQQFKDPILLQLGIVQPGNLYELLKKLCYVYDIQDYQKLITQPQPNQPVDPKEENAMMTAGYKATVNPLDNHKDHFKVHWEFGKSEEFGFLEAEHVDLLASHIKETEKAIQLEEIMEKQRRFQTLKQEQSAMGGGGAGGGVPSPKAQPMMPPGGGLGTIGG